MSVLDISTGKPSREYITVDGVKYELASMEELSYKQRAYISRLGKRLQNVDAIDDPDNDDTIEEMIYKSCRFILPDIPDEVYGKLTDMQRLKVMQVFTELESRKKDSPEDPTKSTE